MGEFGAVSVVSGHIRGQTNTMPLHIEIVYNEYQFAAAFAVASLLALLGYLVARGHLRIDFAGLMALVGLVLHHRRAVPVIPRLFPK